MSALEDKLLFQPKPEREVKNCLTCGATFYPNRDRKKYCGRACFGAANKGSGNPSWSGGKEKRSCVVCGGTFERFRSIVTATCSEKCHSEKMRGLFSAENNPNWRGGTKKKCISCGKEFWQCPSRNKFFCSLACFHKTSFNRNAPRWKTKWGGSGRNSGKRPDLGIYVRSSWEANYARYLNWLKNNGQIISWEYEADTFEFKKIKKGVRFYTPDFKVRVSDSRFEYHEVKGWMHPKGKTALKRMTKYYPDITILLIGKKEYLAIERQMKRMIPGWE